MPTHTTRPIGGEVLVATSHDHPTLDPVVQTYLDRCGEGHPAAGRPDPERGAVSELFRPRGGETETVPVILYVHAGSLEDRSDALQGLSDRSMAAVLPVTILPEEGPAGTERRIDDALATLASESCATLDRSRLAFAADGLGALPALSFAAAPRKRTRPSLLVLVTPVLGPPADGCLTLGLDGSTADALARSAIRLAGSDRWPADRPRERLRRLPPMLLVTAEIDPFRDAAEDFARKMMAAEHEISANRILGMIHGFSWLPHLGRARGAIDAQCLMACAFREAFSAAVTETVGC